MARIQTYENETSITAGGVTRYDTSNHTNDDTARALAGFGSTVANVGLSYVKEQQQQAESLDNVRLQSAVLDHEDRVRQFAQDQAPNYTGDGTDGAGYTAAVQAFAAKDAAATIKNGGFSSRADAQELPYKFQNASRSILASVSATELDSGLKFQSATNDRLIGGLVTQIANAPDSEDAFNSAKKQWLDYTTTANMDRPNLQARVAQVGIAKLERARLEAWVAAHPDDFKKLSTGIFADAPAANSTPLVQNIVNAANDHGVDPVTMLAIGQIESSLTENPPPNAKSSAAGPFQVLNSSDTLSELGITADQRTDSAVVSQAASAYIARQTAVMKSRNIPVTPGKQYMTWQMGPGMAFATMTASPDTPMSSIVNSVLRNRSPEYRAQFMANNPGFYGPGATAGQVVATFEQKMEAARTQNASNVAEGGATADDVAHSVFDKMFPGGAPQLGAKDLGEVQILAAKKSAETAREQQNAIIGQGAIAGAIKIDPRDDSKMKAVNQEVVKQNLASGIIEGDPASLSRAAKITDNVGAAPEAFVNAYSASINGGDAKAKMTAYATVADMQARNPGAYDATKFTADDRKRFDEYIALTTVSNLEADDAVKRIDFYNSPEGKKQAEAQKAGLMTTRDAEIKQLTDKDVIKHFDAPWTWSTPTDSEGKFIAAATEAYKSQYVFFREQGRSVDDAKAMALSSLDKKWGASYVADTGKGANTQTFMPYPPEKSYQPTDVGYDWLTDQAKNHAAAVIAERYPKLAAQYNTPARMTPRGEIPAKLGLKDALGVKLLPDTQTAQEVRGNQPPSYLLAVRLPNGDYDIPGERFTPDQKQANLEAQDRFREAQNSGRRPPRKGRPDSLFAY